MAEVPYYAIKDIPTKRAIQALISEIAGLRKLVAASGGRVVVQESGGGGGGSGYVLPIAKSNVLGGIKVGPNLTIDSQTGVLSTHAPYSLPTASANTLGGVKVGNGLTITDGVLSANGGGGSTVSIQLPTGLTGIEIAKLTIDGTTYSIIAPSGGGGGGGGGGGTRPTQNQAVSAQYSGNPLSKTIFTSIGDLIIASVAYGKTGDPIGGLTGWTYLADIRVNTSLATRLSLYYTFATSISTTFSISVNTGYSPSSNCRVYLNSFSNAGTPIVYADNLRGANSDLTISLVKDTAISLFWAIHDQSPASSDKDYTSWVCSDNSVNLYFQSEASPRANICTVFDGRDTTSTYTLSTNQSGSVNQKIGGICIAIPAAS